MNGCLRFIKLGAVAGVVLMLLAIAAVAWRFYGAARPSSLASAQPPQREAMREQMRAYGVLLCRDIASFQDDLADATRAQALHDDPSASADLQQAALALDAMQRDADASSPFGAGVTYDLTLGIGYSRNTLDELREYLDRPAPAIVGRVKADIAGAGTSIGMARALMSQAYQNAGGPSGSLCEPSAR